MLAGGSLTLFHVRGIRIGVDYSWFIVLFLVIFWLTGFYKDVLGGDDETAAYTLAVASALLFFASILLHELGHALVAIRNGIRISGINLWLFGGVARMERDTDSAGAEFRIAIAGPLVTLAIVAVCVGGGLAAVGADRFADAMRVEKNADVSGVLALVAWLGSINALILLFNLLPAYPLDGGRIARAIAWWRTGDRNRATRFAATLGQGFAYLFIGFGVFLLVTGDVLGGIWIILIGFILNQAAGSAVAQTAVASRLEGVRVGDVMDTEPVAIPAETSVERALEEYFLRYRWPWFPVVDAAGGFQGVLQREAADAVPEGRKASARVAEFVDGGGKSPPQVRDDEPLEALLGNEELRRLGGLVAVDAAGRLSGVITLDQVGRALRDAVSGPPTRPG